MIISGSDKKMFRLYNTLTKTKEVFQPLHLGKVGMYTCGPTVYDFIHIGNIRAYTGADVLRRYLEYLGYEVRHIKNITDVGHLTQDDIAQGDTGEDKIEKKAKKEKKTPEEIAAFYEEYFHRTEEKMNILPARYFPRASAHVPQMIKIISRLLKKKHAYEKNGNVFFDVTSFPEYGRLSGNTLENLKVGARLEAHPDKKNPWDFALWLSASKEHLLKWESPWSPGYPGWHIECSAMSTEYLGDTLDIHTGGEDNIFPHHEAEIAQTECYTGNKFVRYWAHNRHLLVDGEKMSKSKGNFYVLEDVEKKGYAPEMLRLAILSSHYRSPMNFTWNSMEQARSNMQRISDWLAALRRTQGRNSSATPAPALDLALYQRRVEEAMSDDLNTPLALSALYDLITESNTRLSQENLSSREATAVLNVWEKINKIFGLKIQDTAIEIPQEIRNLAEQRKQAKINKDFSLADEVRKKINEAGYTIEDLKNNSYIIKKY